MKYGKFTALIIFTALLGLSLVFINNGECGVDKVKVKRHIHVIVDYNGIVCDVQITDTVIGVVWTPHIAHYHMDVEGYTPPENLPPHDDEHKAEKEIVGEPTTSSQPVPNCGDPPDDNDDNDDDDDDDDDDSSGNNDDSSGNNDDSSGNNDDSSGNNDD